MAVLAARDLAFGHHGRPVGQGVSLQLQAGEVLCLLGPNGGGKTTLLKTLVGLKPALGGAVAVEGEPLARWDAARRARVIGFVPQSAPASFAFSVREIVLMGRAARHGLFAQPDAADRMAADAALARVGAGGLADRAFTALSGGERQMVLIARALAQGPRLLVLDEPTASLDFANQDKVLELIAAVAAEGLGVLFSTHHPDQAFAVGTHVAMLREGTLMRQGPVAQVLTAENLTRLYGRPVGVGEVEGRKVCFTRARPGG
ncbi:ABC transporter ATP-binding protein [Xanthobacter sp. V4C-4]|uniref:ABC transporter ATP-binding protein n=1 Tax=Xanthobacter cornucopiae TaxID=3119924 RepID=UPI00372C453E